MYVVKGRVKVRFWKKPDERDALETFVPFSTSDKPVRDAIEEITGAKHYSLEYKENI